MILRKNLDTGKRDEVPVDLNKVMHLKTEDVHLQASDILFVPDSTGKRALHRAGDVAIQSNYGSRAYCRGKTLVLNRFDRINFDLLELMTILWMKQTI